MAFSSMLKKLREQRNLSQKDIAQYLGVTRQAVASYELGKREPDYEILRKLADFFGISVDYLLGRSENIEVYTPAIGRNIDIIKGNMSYRELSEDIRKVTGALIFPEMLELYAKGERTPFIGTIKILAQYASVSDGFFYRHNTRETYERERLYSTGELYKRDASAEGAVFAGGVEFIDDELYRWLSQRDNLPYVRMAKELQRKGISVEEIKKLFDA